MKERFIDSSINFITKYVECNDLKIKKLKYGLEGIYHLTIKLVTVLLISLITKSLKETCIFLLFYAGIRTFSFGIHAKTNLGCWICSITIYNLIPIMIKNITIPDIIGYIALGIGFISMLLWSPADTPKRPLIRKEQRKISKTFSLLIVIGYAIIYYINDLEIIKHAIICSLLIQSIMINPITYKINKTQFNNYKHYKKKEKMV